MLSWLCQVNSPLTLTTITSWPLKVVTVLGDQCSSNCESWAQRLLCQTNRSCLITAPGRSSHLRASGKVSFQTPRHLPQEQI